MSKINPDDGMDVGTVVIVCTEHLGEYSNGDYGTIIEDDGDREPRVRFSDGEERWVFLRDIRPKTLNDATPAEWDKASKFAYAGDTTSMLGNAKAANAVLTAASRARLDTMASSIATGLGVGKIAYVNVPTEDVIDSPSHYNNGGIECIDYIRQQLGEEGYIAYCEGNMIKYQHRYKYKGGIEDLEKSCKYQEWLIEALKAKEEIAMTEMTQRNV
jgi:hypothetical protein